MKVYEKLDIPNTSAWDKKTWRYYYPSWFKNIVDGIKNIIVWIPTIFKDKDWDDFYILNILQYKLFRQRKYLVENNRTTSTESINRYITICLNLIERIKEEYYIEESYNYYKRSVSFLPSEEYKGYYEVETKIEWEKYDLYLNKYKNDLKKLNLPSHYSKTQQVLALAHFRHQKAKKLLFKILNENLEYWWD